MRRRHLYLDQLQALAVTAGDALAVRDNTGSLSYAQLTDVVARVASNLRARGVRHGDRVVTLMAPSPASLATILGVMAAGGIAAPLNTRLSPPEARSFLHAIDPKLAIAASPHLELGNELGVSVLELPDTNATTVDERLGPLVDTKAWLAALGDADGALLLPTGGTTGTPKAAWWDHRGLIRWMHSIASTDPRRSGDLDLFFSPFFHATLSVGVLAPLFQGAAVLIQPEFSVDRVLDALGDGVTHLVGAPAMFKMLREHPRFETTPRRSVRSVYFGSSPATAAFINELMTDYPSARIRTAYGATEFGGPVTRLEHDDLLAGRLDTVGRPIPGVEISVLDDNGQPCPAGMVGHLVVRSPWRAVGYFGRHDETMDTFRNDGIHIGDLGSVEDGWLRIVGRAKEMIISGGENIFPSEIERIIEQHPQVMQAVAFGVPDPRFGEHVEAAIRLTPGTSLMLEDLQTWCRPMLAGYKLPRALTIIESIPLTANNKPDRAAVYAMVKDARGE